MKIFHAEEDTKLTVELPTFCSLILFDADEMDLMEHVVRTILELELSEEHEEQLLDILDQVRKPEKHEIN